MIRRTRNLIAHFVLFYCYLQIFNFDEAHANSKASSTLTTFRTESLKISLPNGCSNAFEEAFMIMKSYFLHRNKFKESDWENLKARYGFMTVRIINKNCQPRKIILIFKPLGSPCRYKRVFG